jgi:hypothetical protein
MFMNNSFAHASLFQHWYKLGLKHLLNVGETHGQSWKSHPDDLNGVKVEGELAVHLLLMLKSVLT